MGKQKQDWVRLVADRLRTESGSALLLVGVAVFALLWANSPWSESYVHLWETHAAIGIGDFRIDMSLHLVQRLHSRELALRTARRYPAAPSA